MTMAPTTQPTRGYTLVELMVTLAVLAILAMIAVPSFRDTIRRNRVNAASNALLADLRYARTEAINRGQLVSLCPSSDGSNCTADGTDWDAGWLVYTYPAGAASANAAYAAGNILLRAGGGRPDVTIRSSTTNVVSFAQQGQLQPGAGLNFRTCIRVDGEGENSAVVPGMELDLTGSGSLANKALPVAAECTP
ncbi:GspH/FimT family pseudopilin [Rhodanobacter sp. PCA2]|uniref:GspH/FimT family pseudopilin n=1 Tax=Rhodanobacter sp. PCA2 TaxID=2006117 RepID=UPI0015E6F676|nr:GspH/FimT family pseudopilin [Rhodanobacter sp. PCA2]MBA2078003.1 prepilin-type cleavage/methylation domain-containing protein [Rhodanobacter sp. PCA2]